MQNWDAEKYLNSVSAPNISLEEERRLFAIIKGEDSTDNQKQDAIDSICRSHIRFVSQMADYYCKRCPVDMEDMIGAGVIGMITAIEKFDLDRNVKFTTYAGHWIKLEMIRHIQDSCPVVIPQSVHDGLIKIKTAIREADRDLSREELKDKLEFSEEKMQKLEKAKVQTVSLQNEQKSSGETSFLEDIISDGGDTPYESIERDDLLRYLKELLEELDEKTLEIVMSKHSETKIRLQDLADKYGVSPERIRQIREDITNKLRRKVLEKNHAKSDLTT
jgi:RNA polymerase sigma factor (sigma-70 family)